MAAYVGGRAVFVGGDVGRPCPPNADCAGPPTYADDGAAYVPASRQWRRIADAPVPVPDLATHAVVGQHLFILIGAQLLDYDAAADRWLLRTVPGRQPGSGTQYALTADGSRLVLCWGSTEDTARPDRALDTRTWSWTTLPRDGLGASFDRTITATAAGLVVTSHRLDAGGNPADPSVLRTALLEKGADRYRRLPTSDQLGGGRWVWTGTRMVDPTLGGSDGGETDNYGRTIPFGGRLEPGTGTWSRLPDPPAEGEGGWAVEALDGPVMAAAGWWYDDTEGTWTRISRPSGAPPFPGVGLWAGDSLLVLGGSDWEGKREGAPTAQSIYSTGFWACRRP